MPTWSSGISLKGVAGSAGVSVLTGTGAPASSLGVSGQAYVQTDVPTLYVKNSSGWSSGVSLVGTAGSNATLPNDITGNSVILAPVSGDATATQVTIKDSSGNTVFSATASGISTTGNATVGGTATVAALQVNGSSATSGNASVSGNSSGTRLIATSAGSASSPMVQYTSTAAGTKYTSGIYSEPNFAGWFETVGGYNTRSVKYVSGNPNDNGVGFVAHDFLTAVTGGSRPAYRFYVGGSSVALQIAGNGAASFASSVTAAGLSSSAGVTLSSGSLTFSDGTSLSTATAANPASFTVTSTGTAASPAFKYAGGTNPSGVYFDSTPGNVLLSVNGYKSLYSTAASGAAQGANGWAIASTLGSGSNLLALYGSSSTTTPVWAVDGAGSVVSSAQNVSGTVSAGNLTINATGGKLTFGDGTTMTTAATGGSGSGGSASQFVATALGSATAPALTQTTNSNSGVYFSGSGTSSAVQVAANGTNVATFNTTGLVLPSGGGGKITFADGTTQATASSGSGGTSNGITATGSVFGPQPLVATAITLSSTPYVMPAANTSNACTFVPNGTCSFLGGSISSATVTSATYELYDQTSGVSVWKSAAITSASQQLVGSFNPGTYPMTAGNTHVWRVTGSGSFVGWVVPSYSQVAMVPQNPSVISTYPPFSLPATTTLSSTSQQMLVFGTTNQVQYYTEKRGSYLYQVTATNNASSGYASFNLTASGNSTILYSLIDYSGNSQVAAGATVTSQILLPNQIAFSAASGYVWRCFGTSSGSFTLSMTTVKLS